MTEKASFFKRRKKPLIILGVLIVLVVIVVANMQSRRERSVAVTVDKVKRQDLTAVISARIDTAISGGVRAPFFRPTGPCMAASCASLTPNSSRRSRRLAWLRCEPMAPT
jgi:hypothetical protein